MPRTVNKENYEFKRSEILDAALKLIYQVGYSELSIQDILDKVHISKGTLYHYFDSKEAILDALILRMASEVADVVKPIVGNSNLSAIQKLQGYFDVSLQWKLDQPAAGLPVLRAWYSEKNDPMRQRLTSKLVPLTALTTIPVIQQGVSERVMMTKFPEQLSVMFAQLSLGVSETVAKLMLADEEMNLDSNDIRYVLEAYIDTVERMLGIASNRLKVPGYG